MGEFATYIVIYSGNLLPRYYIGSTSVARIAKGYKGSVESRKWGAIWKSEVKNNPHLFEVVILKKFDKRVEATEYELLLHVQFDVVKSDIFANQSLAMPRGCCGMDVRGRLNPNFGKVATERCKSAISQSNSGKRTVLVSGKRVRILCEDFDAGIHEVLPTSSEVREKIADATSRSMAAKVSKGEHWFTSESHRKLVSGLKKGISRSNAERKTISSGRSLSFERPWELSSYSDVDFRAVCVLVNWYLGNYVVRSKTSANEFRSLCAAENLSEKRTRWLMKALAYDEGKIRFKAICERFKQHENS